MDSDKSLTLYDNTMTLNDHSLSNIAGYDRIWHKLIACAANRANIRRIALIQLYFLPQAVEEKSLGCIHKGGHSPINAVYDYGKQVQAKQGLVIMDTPGNDPSSVAAMVAGGAQVIVFSSGRGSPVGSPIAPVVKITGNKLTFAKMEDNIDFNAAPLIYGEKTVEELGEALLKMVVETACGKQTKAEALGFVETAIARLCNYV
ncbi:MAG: UxaA family hydrolase [Oscillospiraceae bacterium]|nr:UxaA family hydrolase [Oscillospiraceae bacterium]